jgi:hypothetical protein
MTIEKSIDQLTVNEAGIVFYRETTVVDGEPQYHRGSFVPGDDLTGAPADVAAKCAEVWTVEVIAAWQAQLTGAQPPAPVIPASVTMRQARLALLKTGLLATVNQAVSALPGAAGEAARIEWEFSSTVERNRPLVQSLVGVLGITDAQLDELFALAARQ